MTAPSPNLIAHGLAFTTALAKRHAGIPLGPEEVDAVWRELGLLRADLTMVRSIAQKSAAVLDAFGAEGVRLERTPEGRWLATTNEGHATGVSCWHAMSQVVKWQSIATQLQNTMRYELHGTNGRASDG